MYKQQVIKASKMNLAGRTVVNGAWSVGTAFGGHGYSTMAVEIKHTYVAGSDIQMYVEYSHDNSTWHRLQSSSTSSGTATMSDLVYKKTTGATDYMVVNMPINANWIRLAFTSTSGSTDTVTAVARLAVSV
jgi:hypothetical protein